MGVYLENKFDFFFFLFFDKIKINNFFRFAGNLRKYLVYTRWIYGRKYKRKYIFSVNKNHKYLCKENYNKLQAMFRFADSVKVSCKSIQKRSTKRTSHRGN